MTKAELEKLPTSEILAIFNKATGRSTKKFSSRVNGIVQTLRALGPAGSAPKSKVQKERKARRSSGMSFRLAPRPDEQKTPREGTKRALVLAMIGKPEGARFSAIQEKCDWNLKDAYEGVRLLNVFCGFGLWHEEEGEGDYRIWQVDERTYQANVKKANV